MTALPHAKNTRTGKRKIAHSRHAGHAAVLRAMGERRKRRTTKRGLQQRWAR